MATGSPFTGRNTNTDSGNVLNNPIIQANAYREMIAKSAWGSMTVDVDVANDGLVMANSGGEGLVKRVNIAKTAGTRQTRWAYAKEIQGFPATFGQQIAPLADKNQFLYSEAEIAEVRSPLMPVHTDMEQRDGENTLKQFGGSDAMAQRNVRLWAAWQRDADHYAAMLRGASDVYLAPSSIGGLEKDIGGVISATATPTTGAGSTTVTVAGSPVSHENIVAFSGAGDGTISESYCTDASPAARAAHEDNLAYFVWNLQQAGAVAGSNKMTRNSIKGLHSLASKKNIRKLKGKNYDYIYQLDWEAVDQLIGTLDGTTADTKFLVGLWKTLSQGANGDAQAQLMDVRYEDLVLDGILIRPDRYLQAYRPAVVTGAASSGGTSDVGRVLWGCGATPTTKQSEWYGLDKFRSYDANLGKVAVGFLMGDTALISAEDGGIKIMEKEGDFETGKVYGSREWRTIRRAVWQGRDAATANQIRNEGSLLTLSCIDNSIYKF